MRFLSLHRITASRSLTAILGTGCLLATAWQPTPVNASSSGASAQTSSPRSDCRNIPLSSGLVTPTTCLPLPSGVVVVGTATGSRGDGTLAVLTDTMRIIERFRGSGAPSIAWLTSTAVCITAPSGRAAAFDLATGQPTSTETCHGTALLDPTSRSYASAIAPTLGIQHTGRTVALPTVAASGQPSATYSFYVSNSFVAPCLAGAGSGCALWQMGADANSPSGGGINILDFGAPCQDPSSGTPGVQTFFQPVCVSDAVVRTLLQRWIEGYEATHGTGTPQSILAAGLSNSVNGIPNDPQTTAEMRALGGAWATSVVDAVPAGGLAAPLTIWGAIDAEESGGGVWLGPAPTLAFVDQFGVGSGHSSGAHACSISNTAMLADFGDGIYLQGQWDPPGGWSVADIYHVAWGASAACAVPEIYYDVNAEEWQSISQWAVSQGMTPITFAGVMSENGVQGTETAVQSWSSLNSWTGQNIPYLTNIAWGLTVAPATFNPLPPQEAAASFPVTWQQASGLAHVQYQLFESDNSGPWVEWAVTADSQATFFARAGHSYNFFIETKADGYDTGGPTTHETGTTVSASAPQTEPFLGLYAVDAYGVVRPGSSPPLAESTTWPGWKIARGLALTSDANGGYVLDGWGGIHPVGDAPALASSTYWPGWDIARGIVLGPDGEGGYILDGWGGVHAFGDAKPVKVTAYWPGWDIARGIVLLPDGQSGYVLDGWGGIHPFGTLGDIPPVRVLTAYWPGWDIARGIVLTLGGTGGYVVDGWGGLHPFGTATAVSQSAYWPGWDIARAVVMEPGLSNAGWTVDAWGGFHPFGTAPGVTSNLYIPGDDAIRGAGAV